MMVEFLMKFIEWLQEQGLHIADDCFEAPLEQHEYKQLVEEFWKSREVEYDERASDGDVEAAPRP